MVATPPVSASARRPRIARNFVIGALSEISIFAVIARMKNPQ
jgi:hypothetical protein